MGTRNETVFSKSTSFIKAVGGFDKSVSRMINGHTEKFEIAWCGSRHDGDLPSGYCVEQDKKVNGPYQLYQIRVGPGRGYRAWVMFLDESPDAYWIYAFKKEKDRQPEDMERARVLALKYWKQIRRGSNG